MSTPQYLTCLQVFLSVFILSLPSLAQEGTEGTAQNFSLSPDDLGALQNSVNLYTGQVSFPMTIASLPGRGGLSPRITINYNSAGVRKAVTTWNREQPTGILGLGWSFEFPRIVADHNNTATRHDDTFYLVEGGQSVRLICTEHSLTSMLTYRPYKTEIYQPWRIEYYFNEEKWVIIKDDGVRYEYGDNTRPKQDGTLQNMIAWDNWIGNSNVSEGQEELAYIWNLSSIENLWSDKITYYYDNIEESVGGNFPAKHTRASVLSRIVGPTGNSFQLGYGMKEYQPCVLAGDFRCTDRTREYQDPHVESPEPDAYQEKYEPRFLQSIAAFDHRGLPLYDVALTYETANHVGKGEFAKRLLKSIEQTNYTGAKLPKTTFEYIMEEGPMLGYLYLVDNSIGGNISYQYEELSTFNITVCPTGSLCYTYKSSSLGVKNLTVRSPSIEWREPDVFMGPDYAVVIWRKNPAYSLNIFNPVSTAEAHVEIYQWDGKWVKHSPGALGNLGDLSLNLFADLDRREMAIAMEKDHFGIVTRQGTHQFKVSLFHKSKYDGDWSLFSETVSLFQGRLTNGQYVTELYPFAGRDYFTIGNLESDFFYLYKWNGTAWEKLRQDHPLKGMAYAGSTNYVLSHATGPNPDQFKMHLLREDKKWEINTFNAGFDTRRAESNKERSNRTYWYSTPAFMFTMANSNWEKAFVLGKDYLSFKEFDLRLLPDYYPVTTPSTSNINISAYPLSDFKRFNQFYFYRYDGKKWNERVLFVPPLVAKSPRLYRAASDVIGYSLGESSLSLLNYDANIGDWKNTDLITPVNWLDRIVQVSQRSALMGQDLYYLEPDGNWLNIGSIPTSLLAKADYYQDVRSAHDLYVISEPYRRTHFYNINNGQVTERSLTANMDKRSKFYDVGKKLLGNGIMVAFSPAHPEKFNARKLRLYKWQDDEYSGGHSPVVVKNVRVNDGVLDIDKAYKYESLNARIDRSGHIPLFNQVTVVTGSDDPDIHPKGYTRHYFHHGGAEISKLPQNQVHSDWKLYAGSVYRTEMYDSQNNLLTDTETVLTTYKQNISNTSGEQIDQSYFVRPTRSITRDYLTEGTQIAMTVTAYNPQGYPDEVTNYSGTSIATAKVNNTMRYIYYPEAYDETQHNIYSEVIGTETLVNGQLVASNATVWQVLEGRPQAVKNYNWLGFGSGSFTAWNGATPATQWRLSNQIAQRDSKGNILQSLDFMDETECSVYDSLQINPVVSASYASYDQLVATSFEDGQAGNMVFPTTSATEAYTGTHSLHNASATTPVLPNNTYSVYYWYKNAPGTVSVAVGTAEDLGDQLTANGWTLRQWRVTGSGMVTISTTGYLDELRVHPEEAYVTTYTYDGYQKKVAETGPDMITTYFYYDDYHRQHYVSDHDGDIVLYYEYGFKKLEE